MAGDGKPYILHLSPGTPSVEWCATCLLPSRVVIPVYAMSEDGPWQIGTYDRCEDCTPSKEAS